jgi:hypothetical protein
VDAEQGLVVHCPIYLVVSQYARPCAANPARQKVGLPVKSRNMLIKKRKPSL